jgi:cyclopropane fatty-acyl-phospholipid synthase-like methyltransferase
MSITGYQAYKTFEDLLIENHVFPINGTSILDWGCGFGRVLRHFLDHWKEAEIWGADIDAENVLWAAKSFQRAKFQLLQLMPPSLLPSNKFDAIYGLSVMTHLTHEAQEAWIKELARCLKPNGLALLTFGGQTVAAYTSMHRSPQWWETWLIKGFDDHLHDPSLDKQINDQSYYRQTLQAEKYVKDNWSKEFNIVKIIRDAFGNLDVAILRKK